jgi:hypothetical protein
MLCPPIEGATVSTPSTVDETAPVLAHHEIDIRAPLDTVWRLHTNVNAWTNWQTDITDALDRAAGVGQERPLGADRGAELRS